jgi:transcriptional regulator with XRE-family HTH domain
VKTGHEPSHLNRRPIGRAFGQVLRKMRKAAGYKQGALARRAGIDLRYVSVLERGRRTPSIAIVFALAVALGTTPERMLRLARLSMLSTRSRTR